MPSFLEQAMVIKHQGAKGLPDGLTNDPLTKTPQEAVTSELSKLTWDMWEGYPRTCHLDPLDPGALGTSAAMGDTVKLPGLAGGLKVGLEHDAGTGMRAWYPMALGWGGGGGQGVLSARPNWKSWKWLLRSWNQWPKTKNPGHWFFLCLLCVPPDTMKWEHIERQHGEGGVERLE